MKFEPEKAPDISYKIPSILDPYHAKVPEYYAVSFYLLFYYFV